MHTQPSTSNPFFFALLFGIVLSLQSPGTAAYHGTLYVTVNGQRLTPQQIHQAEQATGVRLRSGHYWYDHNSGLWGVVDGPVLGRAATVWSQGNTVTESYSGGGGASRNPYTGTGIITDGSGGFVLTR